MKSLIVFYSRNGENYINGKIVDTEVGNAFKIANALNRMIDSDLYEIKTVRKYSKIYKECLNEASNDLKNNYRPLVLSPKIDLKKYNKIYLIYPNFWSDMPVPVMSFLESYDFNLKEITPICTHEGSGMGKSEETLKRLAKGAKINKGLAIRGSLADEASEYLRKIIR